MTGEADAQKKNSSKPFMLSGCQVADGSGRMLVSAVGENSEWGRTLSKLTEKNEDTPLQEKLDDMAKSKQLSTSK
jgi:Ca2+-transporting ATPase